MKCFAWRIFVGLFFSAAFLTQTICLDDTTVKFEIWDTAGQERYHSLAPMYYRGAQAAIVVYDITNTVGSTCRETQTLLGLEDKSVTIYINRYTCGVMVKNVA